MNNRFSTAGSFCCRGLEDEVLEVSLLLPAWQVTALESAAHDRGLTAAEMVRTLVRDFIADQRDWAGPLALATRPN